MAATKNSKAKTTQPATKAEDNGVTQDPQAQPKENATPPPATVPEPDNTKRIAVKSMTPSFRRAGFQFSHRETILDVGRLTDEQLQAIHDEPRLVVRPVEQED